MLSYTAVTSNKQEISVAYKIKGWLPGHVICKFLIPSPCALCSFSMGHSGQKAQSPSGTQQREKSGGRTTQCVLTLLLTLSWLKEATWPSLPSRGQEVHPSHKEGNGRSPEKMDPVDRAAPCLDVEGIGRCL